jgi:hypothetical protein
VDELDDSPSIIMQVRSSREERSRRPFDDGGPRRHDGERRPHDDDGGPRRHEGERRPHDGDRPRRSAEPRPAEPRPAETTDGGASGEAAGDDQ